MAMWMFRIMMPGYDILGIANPHLLHPFLGNLHHKCISFFIIRETDGCLVEEKASDMYFWDFYFRAHRSLYLKRIGYGFIANSTDSFGR